MEIQQSSILSKNFICALSASGAEDYLISIIFFVSTLIPSEYNT